MVKALVTGGTGFVGSHLTRQLIDAGHQVRVMHRTTSKLDALAGLEYESTIGDILDEEALRKACEGCDWVFHVAAVVDYWRADKSRMFKANIDGTRYLLNAARDAGVQRVVFTSSGAALGVLPGQTPTDETVDFNMPPHHFPYGYSKHLAEKVVAEAVQAGQDVVTVNPVVILGPGDLNMISGSFITQIKQLQWLVPITNGGIAITDVRDVARWQIAAAEKGEMGERYILSSANYSYETLFSSIAEVVGVRKPLFRLPNFIPPIVALGIEMLRRVGIHTLIDATQARMGTQYVYFDPTKTWDELGEPQIDMRHSLENTYRWYLDNGYLKSTPMERMIARVGRVFGR